jgi:methyl-accepting chemotaxis protein
MNQRTQDVTVQAAEQRLGGEQVVKSLDRINQAAGEAVSSTDLIANSAADLQHQANELLAAIAFFKLSEELTRQVASSVPAPRLGMLSEAKR